MMQCASGCSTILLVCVAVLSIGQCIAFVQAPAGSWRARSYSLQYPNAPGGRRHAQSSSSGLRMGKGGGRGGRPPKRKRKSTSEQGKQAKQTGSPSSGGETSVADAEYSSKSVKAVTDLEGAGAPMSFEDAGAPIRYEGAGERLGMDTDMGMVDSSGRAAPGVMLKDGVIGADEEREAKIEETLRRLGVKGASADEKQDKKKRVKKQRGKSQGSAIAMEDKGDLLSSVIGGIPAETQLVLERGFIAGFILCLSVFVFSGVIIGLEAYQMATVGKLPQDLDDVLVQKLQPLFTPALVATFACSISLGILKLGQMGQADVVYREDD